MEKNDDVVHATQQYFQTFDPSQSKPAIVNIDGFLHGVRTDV